MGSDGSLNSNQEMVDMLCETENIKSVNVELAFRSVDRGDYSTAPREIAYENTDWREGHLYLSSPVIYARVLQNMELRPGLSFLNLGSGTGYLNTMAGLILGRYGINHGIELYSDVVDYATLKLEYFLKTSNAVDQFDFCEAIFKVGNFLAVDSSCQQYDRVYCGVNCPGKYVDYMKNFVKVGGILIINLREEFWKATRMNESKWRYTHLAILLINFFITPSLVEETVSHIELDAIAPPRLQELCRFTIRGLLRKYIDLEHPNLKFNLLNLDASKGKRRIMRCPFLNYYQIDSDFTHHLTEYYLTYHDHYDSPNTNISSINSSNSKNNSSENDTSKSKTTEEKKDVSYVRDTTETYSSDNELNSLITVPKVKSSNSSDELNSHQLPCQSTTNKRKRFLNQKRPRQSVSPDNVSNTSSGTTSGPRENVNSSSLSNNVASTSSDTTSESRKKVKSSLSSHNVDNTNSGTSSEPRKKVKISSHSQNIASTCSGTTSEPEKKVKSSSLSHNVVSTSSVTTNEPGKTVKSSLPLHNVASSNSGTTSETGRKVEISSVSHNVASTSSGTTNEQRKKVKRSSPSHNVSSTNSDITSGPEKKCKILSPTHNVASTSSGTTNEPGKKIKSSSLSQNVVSTSSGTTSDPKKKFESSSPSHDVSSTSSGTTSEPRKKVKSSSTSHNVASTSSDTTSEPGKKFKSSSPSHNVACTRLDTISEPGKKVKSSSPSQNVVITSSGTTSESKKKVESSSPSDDVASTSLGTTGESMIEIEILTPSASHSMANIPGKSKIEEVPNFNYTRLMVQKIKALPLSPALLKYLNYQRDNL